MHANRPSTAPDFLLSRATGSVRTQGAKKTFTDTDAAINALRTGNVEMIVGALPFNPDEAVALTEPASIIREDGPLEPHAYYRQGTLNARVTGFDPEPEEHLRRVDAAIATIQSSKLDKVVLARGVDIEFAAPVDPRFVAARLIDLSANRDGFIADLSPAGRPGAMLVGASPEVLVKKQGSTVTAFPLAGSAPRQADKARDHLAGQDLLRSAKDLHEHAFVVDHLRRILSPLCTTLDAPTTPELINTNEMWHLGTPIAGTLKEPALTALELAMLVHPTPAICGTPTEAAQALIETAESDRGFYAGAVGWCDSSGDGEYMVAIRCAEVAGDGLSARAWAGGGIVESSNSQEELAETSAKLRTILKALGL
ncbi:Isochorismate synthase [Corynebacterium striatum]|uniref:isochorismate synthase n=1 Tax=Corynebacterium striatum TaxID=43770 RepID=A0AAQ1Z7B8_CORST|nr:isochorismate synthase [Corynebacterium striatum]EEI79147.1 isochorismate synthase [Corynebacterium striatum ATCC 6940]MBD0857097.1 isochorismate synthase [Corynebacterium striatum]QQE53417.1 isochorismate synthase [Corynebacterium striatum]STD36422.1 Isochorismate synthase [Corynebacterium striatum]STD61966.1 Isochorismate synthase [Corynebacterium striatum]